MIKVLLLADHGSSHVIKWAKSLAQQGVGIGIFSLSGNTDQFYSDTPEIDLFQLDFSERFMSAGSSWRKLKYLRSLKRLKAVIAQFQPDIVHAHYATSYGLLGAMSKFHPFIISVWGSDVFDFPTTSFIHRKLLAYNLKRADKILSTSHVMAVETNKYVDTKIEITPFGVDLNVFGPQEVQKSFNENALVIGTIKTLEVKYGIEYLIRAFALVKEKHTDLPLKLLVVGGGAIAVQMEDLTKELGVEALTTFTGKVRFEDVVTYYNMLDIYVAVSIMDSESFGVAIVEASACEKPVVVSNVGGLPEVVENGTTGIVVPKQDVKATADAIEQLVLDSQLRDKMGKAGRKRVEQFYDWKENVNQMLSIYRLLLTKFNRKA
jgi:glycosyltransferase involved in cell wall biosynthesis